MRSLPLGLILLPLLAVCQATLVTQFQWHRGRPDLVLVTVLAWNLVSHQTDGLLWAFVGGLAVDGLSGGPMGATILGLLAVGLMGSLIGTRLWETHWILPLTAVVIGTGIHHLLYLSVLAITGWPVSWLDALTTISLPSAVLNTALMLPIYPAARWLAAQIAPTRVEI